MKIIKLLHINLFPNSCTIHVRRSQRLKREVMRLLIRGADSRLVQVEALQVEHEVLCIEVDFVL